MLLCLPSAVSAVGLGKLTVQSSLGQPLRAEIALLSVQKDELSSIVARVAPASVYKDANIERTGLAASLKFAVAQKSNGESYLKVTSAQPINEPFLDVLIELSWTSGRLLREYTVLLDPPGFVAPEPVAPVAAPQIRAVPTPAERPATPAPVATAEPSATPSAPVAATTTPSAKTSKRARGTPAPSKPALTPAEQTFPKFDDSGAPAATAASSASSSAQDYAIKRGDTLNKIASDLKVDSVSLEQMLAGLYQANPDAFIGKNMNRLRVGQILRVPPAQELAAIEPAAARKQVKAHVADWNTYRQKLAQSTEAAPAAPEGGKQSASGAITSTVEDKAAPASPSQDVLKLSKGETSAAKNAGGAAGSASTTQDKLRALEEENVAKEKSLKEANSRVAALESNIKDMQRLLEIRNQTLADLQKQANKSATGVPAPSSPTVPTTPVKPSVGSAPQVNTTPAPASGTPSAQTPAPGVTPAPPASAPAPLLRALPDTQQSAPSTTVVTPPPAAPATPDAATGPSIPPTSNEPVTTPPAATVSPPVAAKEVAPKPVAAPVTPKPTTEETSFLSSIAENPLYLGAAVVALLLLAALALMWRSNQRRKSLSSFEDSIMTGGDLKANTVFGDTAGGVIDTGDTSFLTDFSQAGMGTIDTNDVDPIAEAEVYMAYGRDAQAEEILKEALSKDPSRHEIQVKLLEIYASRKNVAAYETLAGELYAAIGGRSHPLWHKVAEMGRELDPNNPLYAPEAGVKAADVAPVAAAGAAAAVAGSMFAAPEENRANDDTLGGLDFSVDRDDEIDFEIDEKNPDTADFQFDSAPKLPEVREASSHHATPQLPDEPADTSSLDFDSIIPQAVDKQGSYESPAHEDDNIADDVDNSFGLDLDLEESLEGPPTIAPAVESPASDFDEIYKPASAVATSAPRAPEVDLSRIDLNLGERAQVSDNFDADMVFTDTESHWQEVATKLDLAKAYMDMGDKDGAREILQEVVEEGEPEQKSDAKKLLAALV